MSYYLRLRGLKAEAHTHLEARLSYFHEYVSSDSSVKYYSYRINKLYERNLNYDYVLLPQLEEPVNSISLEHTLPSYLGLWVSRLNDIPCITTTTITTTITTTLFCQPFTTKTISSPVTTLIQHKKKSVLKHVYTSAKYAPKDELATRHCIKH